jgi:hypothetical protein
MPMPKTQLVVAKTRPIDVVKTAETYKQTPTTVENVATHARPVKPASQASVANAPKMQTVEQTAPSPATTVRVSVVLAVHGCII